VNCLGGIWLTTLRSSSTLDQGPILAGYRRRMSAIGAKRTFKHSNEERDLEMILLQTVASRSSNPETCLKYKTEKLSSQIFN